MEPILSPMTALWTSSEAGMKVSREGRPAYAIAWLRAHAIGGRPSRKRIGRSLFDGNRSAARPAISVMGRRQLRHQSRDPVLHFGEGHGVDDLVGDAVVILPPEMRLAPEIVELDG